MSNITWESVEIKQSSRRAGEPFASVGQGRVALNATACDLIENIYQYDWVDVNRGTIGNKVVKIGLRFAKSKGKNSAHIARRKYKGQDVDGININSKHFVKTLFGEAGDSTTKRYKVEKIDGNTLAIDVSREL